MGVAGWAAGGVARAAAVPAPAPSASPLATGACPVPPAAPRGAGGGTSAGRAFANLTFIMNTKKTHLRPYHCVVLSLYLGYRVTHGARTSTTRATDGALRTPGDGSQGAHFTR